MLIFDVLTCVIRQLHLLVAYMSVSAYVYMKSIIVSCCNLGLAIQKTTFGTL